MDTFEKMFLLGIIQAIKNQCITNYGTKMVKLLSLFKKYFETLTKKQSYEQKIIIFYGNSIYCFVCNFWFC